MRIPFIKMHSLGNDFVVIDGRRLPHVFSPSVVRMLSDRRRGVGFDQLLILEDTVQQDCDFAYRVINADGTPSVQCGNGARCMARFLVEAQIGTQRKWRWALADGSTMQVIYRDNETITALLPPPDFSPAALPFRAETAVRYRRRIENKDMTFGAVSIGNPHVVFAVPAVADAAVATIGAAVQRHADFPESVNVGFAEYVSDAHIRLRVFERGAGETTACGSGACAAVCVLQAWDMVSTRVCVSMPGGDVTVEYAGGDVGIRLTGGAERSFCGELELPEAV